MAVGALFLILRLSLLRVRYFDTDELEHLHAALSLAHGNVPYLGFFENHPPFLYLLLAPLARLIEDPLSLIAAGRLLMAGLWAGLLGLQWLIPGPGASDRERACGTILLAAFTTFSMKALEIRPDVPAALLFGVMLLAASRTGKAWGWALGLAFGAGLLFSLKLLYPGLGLVVWATWSRRDWRPAAGALLPAAATAAVFAALGAWRPLWADLVLFNLRMQAGFSPLAFLGPSLRENPALWALSLVGAAGGGAPAAAVASGLAGLFVLPSVYPQYYVLLGPALAALAARPAAAWLAARGARPWLARLALAASMASCLAAHRAASARDNRLQAERIRCVSEKTAPGERVFDTWTGESFHRPHAAYFWFLPEDAAAVVEPAALESSLSEALRDPRTRGLIWSETYMPQLPPAALEAAKSLYAPAGCGRLHLRKA